MKKIKSFYKMPVVPTLTRENVKTEPPIVTEADLISDKETEILHTRLLLERKVDIAGIEMKIIESSYKMPVMSTSVEENADKLQEAEKAKMARQEYERKARGNRVYEELVG